MSDRTRFWGDRRRGEGWNQMAGYPHFNSSKIEEDEWAEVGRSAQVSCLVCNTTPSEVPPKLESVTLCIPIKFIFFKMAQTASYRRGSIASLPPPHPLYHSLHLQESILYPFPTSTFEV